MFSIIIASPSTEIQTASGRYLASLFAGGKAEVIGLPPMPSAADTFNHGAAIAKGELLIFSRGQVEFLASDFHFKLLRHMQHCDLLGFCGTPLACGPSWISAGPPHVYGQLAMPNPNHPGWTNVFMWSVPQRRADGMQALDGLFLCVRRSVVESLHFDAESFKSYSAYDIDFTFRAYKKGFRLSVANDLNPISNSMPMQDAQRVESARSFDRKYQHQLPVHLRQSFQTGIVSVPSREEIVDVMSPPHWKAISTKGA